MSYLDNPKYTQPWPEQDVYPKNKVRLKEHNKETINDPDIERKNEQQLGGVNYQGCELGNVRIKDGSASLGVLLINLHTELPT
jgi:hypothetical protein